MLTNLLRATMKAESLQRVWVEPDSIVSICEKYMAAQKFVEATSNLRISSADSQMVADFLKTRLPLIDNATYTAYGNKQDLAMFNFNRDGQRVGSGVLVSSEGFKFYEIVNELNGERLDFLVGFLL